MFVPNGYMEFRHAAALVPDCDDGWGSDDPKCERLGGALASGDLIAHGVVVGAAWNDEVEVEGLGTIRELKPEAWRMPAARNAVMGQNATGQLRQDDYILTPIIQRSAFLAWRKVEFATPLDTAHEQQSSNTGMPGLSYGVHAIPSGYVAFDQIRIVARGWAQSGTIDRDLLPLLDPPDANSMTEALASGLLPTFGISKRTGEIIPLPPSTWRMEVGGFSQSLWAIRGDDVRSGHDSDPCLPVVTRADLARALQATSIPPDPSELPVGWKPATPIRPTFVALGSTEVLGIWMLGYAEGFKSNGRLVKREEAIRAAREKRSCTTRQAERAFEALPYPELRNPPRTPAG